MRNEGTFTVVVWGLIVVAGLGAAYLCFGILHSQANEKVAQYSVDGAIAGALISWGVLLSIYLQLQNSGNGIRDLRRENEDLKHKLIRGAPRPQGFDIEVDERQRIVLARPKDWEPKGGIIFQLELANAKMERDDTFAATFQCSFVPIPKDSNQTLADFHSNQIKSGDQLVRTGYIQSYSHEIVRLGGDATGVESLKFIARQFARVEITTDPATQRQTRSWWRVTWAEFANVAGWISTFAPNLIPTGAPNTITLYGTGFHDGAACYVNEQKRDLTVLNPGAAQVTLLAEDTASPSNLGIHIQNPAAGKTTSNSVSVVVAEPTEAWQPFLDSAARSAKEAPAQPARPAAPQQAAANPEPAAKAEKAANSTADPKPGVPVVVYLEIVSMTVACRHEELEKTFYFEFWDDANDFLKSSDEFNRILDSTRFLS